MDDLSRAAEQLNAPGLLPEYRVLTRAEKYKLAPLYRPVYGWNPLRWLFRRPKYWEITFRWMFGPEITRQTMGQRKE